jgi:beta-galactosidase
LGERKEKFEVSGAGEIVGTDNGDPADLVSFASKERAAFNGLVLVIIRSKARVPGIISVTAKADGFPLAQATIKSQ